VLLIPLVLFSKNLFEPVRLTASKAERIATPRKELSSSASCRFIPAHRNGDYFGNNSAPWEWLISTVG
jgi:hypothetical protein